NFTPDGPGFSKGDRFSSFLVKVTLKSDGETFQPGEQAKVVVKERDSGKVVQESSIGPVYIGPSGVSYYPVLVTGHVCDALVVEVTGKPKSIVKPLSFNCGE